MRRLKLLLSVAFFTCYLAVQCALCLRSIASEVRLQYGFGMYTSKSLAQRPYRVVRLDGTRETFEMRRARPSNELQFVSKESGNVLVYRVASKPSWSAKLLCRAHSPDAVAIEWSEGGSPKRFACSD